MATILASTLSASTSNRGLCLSLRRSSFTAASTHTGMSVIWIPRLRVDIDKPVGCGAL